MKNKNPLPSGMASQHDAPLSHVRELHRWMVHRARLATTPPLPSPDQIGTLSGTEIKILFNIIRFIGQKWFISDQSQLSEFQFQYYMNLKTSKRPSYLTAYQYAIQMFSTLVQRLGSEQAALEYMYSPDPEDPPENWEVVRAWVIQEYLELYVTQGAFRAYGWLNYPGWVGGSYSNPLQLPYRRCPNA